MLDDPSAARIAYRSASPESRLIWFDRNGKTVDSFPVPADYHHPSLSPDEKRVAIERTDAATGQHTIWIVDFSRGTISRLVHDPSGAHSPVWSPDGSRVAFLSLRLSSAGDLFWTRVDGGDSGELFRKGRLANRLVARRTVPRAPIQPPGAERHRGAHRSVPSKGTTVRRDGTVELQGQLSPDVRWMAYTSDESGAPDVYVRRFPDGEGKRQVSTHGGAQPQWRRDGKELFYLAVDGKLMAAAAKAGPSTFDAAYPERCSTPASQGRSSGAGTSMS